MDKATAEKIHLFLKDRTDEMVEYLKELASIETPSSDASTQDAALSLISQRLEKLGFDCQRIEGAKSGGQLIAKIPQQDDRPKQLLLGHCDTVWPVGTLEKMPVEIREGRLHGPGVYDMKGGLVQALYALVALHELDLTPEVTPVFFINSDEEIGSGESVDAIRELASAVDRAFVMEPSLEPGSRLKTSRKGVGRFYVTAKGRASHAGLAPEKGISAILEMSTVIQTLFGFNDRERGISVNVGKVQGGTQPNVIAAECRVEVDVRVKSKQDAEWIENQIHSIKPTLKDANLDIEGRIGRPPMESTPGNRSLWQRAVEATDVLDISIEEGAAGGGSDGNWTSLSTPTLDGLGAVGDGAHALNEHLLIEKMAERSALLACLLMEPPLS